MSWLQSSHIQQVRVDNNIVLLKTPTKYTMMAKPIRALEFHYPMSQFLIIIYLLTFIITYNRPSDIMRWCDFAHLASNRI